MKYFISNKESEYLGHTKISESDLPNLHKKIDEELYIFPGTLESSKDIKKLFDDIKQACTNDCKIVINVINLYQVFVDVAFHRIDVGIGHLVCKGIDNPFNIPAITALIKAQGLSIQTTGLEDQSKFIRIECKNA